MKGKKFFLYAILMAVWAGIVTLGTWQMNGLLVTSSTPLTYITFIAWAGYFLIGANVKAALVAMASSVVGIISAILMFVLCLAFGFTPWWAVPLAVVIVVPFMMYCEKVKPISNTAVIFLTTGIFFSLAAAGSVEFTAVGYTLAGLVELIYILIGFIAGWVSIQIFTFCSKLGSKK